MHSLSADDYGLLESLHLELWGVSVINGFSYLHY